MKSKTIILSPPTENSNSRGILTLYTEDDLLKCRIRLYSTPQLTPDCKLGIYHQQQVYTANLLNKGGQYESSFVGDFKMEDDFYCAIINTSESNNAILAGGTYAGYYFNDNSIFETTTQEIELKENSENPEENACQDCNKCANCKYKEFFYSSQAQSTPTTPQQETQTTNSPYPTILDSITPQFNHVFTTYPPDEILNKLIPNGKFVQISENNTQYSIGAIYENQEIKYISYATRSNYNATPPLELGSHYQWLPLDNEDPLSEGYYLVFQDAKDLKILEI